VNARHSDGSGARHILHPERRLGVGTRMAFPRAHVRQIRTIGVACVAYHYGQ